MLLPSVILLASCSPFLSFCCCCCCHEVGQLTGHLGGGSGGGRGSGGRSGNCGWEERKEATAVGLDHRSGGARLVGWAGQLKRWVVESFSSLQIGQTGEGEESIRKR
jgi:hypothetical protein